MLKPKNWVQERSLLIRRLICDAPPSSGGVEAAYLDAGGEGMLKAFINERGMESVDNQGRKGIILFFSNEELE